jgi:hypothetical protein
MTGAREERGRVGVVLRPAEVARDLGIAIDGRERGLVVGAPQAQAQPGRQELGQRGRPGAMMR